MIHLKPGREKSLRHRHPWVFSGAIETVEGDPESGATRVSVFTPHREGLFYPICAGIASTGGNIIDAPYTGAFVGKRPMWTNGLMPVAVR